MIRGSVSASAGMSWQLVLGRGRRTDLLLGPPFLLDDADCMHWPRAGGVMGDDYRYMYMYDNFLRKRL